MPTMACIDRSLPAQLLPCSRGGGGTEENIKSATEVTPSSEVITGRKRRGSVTRDRCCRLALDPVPVSGATAPLTTPIWIGRYATVTKGPRIPVGIWPEVVAGAKRKGLRRVAREYAVSHETVRAIVRKVEKGIAQ